MRKGGRKTERGKRKYVHNTVVYVAKSGVSYMLNGHGTKNVLYWFHLEKKCKEQLSLAMKGRVVRNQMLDKLRNGDEITSPTIHHSFRPSLPDLKSQKYQNSLLFHQLL